MFELLGYKDEPMPDFEARYPGRLESCLAQPFATFDRVAPYRGILRKSAALFYFCIKDHPFENGNKRFAVAITLLFLMKNGLWLDIYPHKLYELAKVVAESDDTPQEAIEAMHSYFKRHVEPISSSQDAKHTA